ncbi:metallophosphoesterase, partial [Mailhella massiliensis]|uniref:metallophosphoesterase n=1 Tax=Mailhella massiliensis TaxID=1903261 RepID=UPI0023EF94A8
LFLALAFGISLLVPDPVPAVEALFSSLLSIPVELGMALFSVAAAAFGMARALAVPSVHRVDVAIRGLPKELEGLTIAHLSDLHIGSTFTGEWLEEVVRRTNALEPDFTLITGDLADGTPERIGRFLHPVTKLRARFGVAVSVGNHDYYSGLRDWVDTWRAWGLTVLVNEHREYQVHGRNVVIAGVTDPCAVLFRSLDPSLGAPDTQKALQGAGEGLRILMAHRPGNAEQNAALGCHLQLSGHTHGGQFFFLFPLVSRMNSGFRSGLYRAGSMPLYVSPGTGMWGYVPMRLGVAAEITLLTLRHAPASSQS